MPPKFMIANTWNNKIVQVECLKETDKQAIIMEPLWNGKLRERRTNKEGKLFDTFIDAKNYLIDLSKAEVASLQSRLDSAKAGLKKRNDIPHP